jgi:Heterokaryon incompatibility protein (HET)
MTANIYQQLPADKDAIRLLLLQPHDCTWSSTIKCSLINATISGSRPYEALSYAWGELLPMQKIVLNGQVISVRQNLFDCLLHVRRENKIRWLWIDALCIDQDNLEEKGRQVKLMPFIYETATRVLAWLGGAADESDDLLAFKNIPWVRSGNSPYGFWGYPGLLLDADFVRRTDAFFQRSYWNRTWVVQENRRAKDVLFLCGSFSLKREHLKNFFRELKSAGTRTQIYQLAQSLVDDASLHSSNYDTKCYFAQLLAQHLTSKCANGLDKVYALLGALPLNSPMRSMEIDYSITQLDLFFRTHASMRMWYTAEGDPAADYLRRNLKLSWSKIQIEIAIGKLGANILEVSTLEYSADAFLLRADRVQTIEVNITINELRPNDVIYKFKAVRGIGGDWSTNASVRVGDITYIFRHSRYAMILRLQHNTLSFVGIAWQDWDIDISSKLLKSFWKLHDRLASLHLVPNEPIQTSSEGHGLKYHISVPYSLIAILDSYIWSKLSPEWRKNIRGQHAEEQKIVDRDYTRNLKDLRYDDIADWAETH